MDKKKQVEEMARVIYESDRKHSKILPLSLWNCIIKYGGTRTSEAVALYKAGYRKQSEGEWTFDRDNALNGIEPYRCSVCEGTSQHRRPYCSLCGAKMKGGTE